MLGHGGRDTDAYLEQALAEFRALGERFGISFAQTELAERIAVRRGFAGACKHLEQAIAVVQMRSRQAQLYWLRGDEEACAASLAEAQRHAERIRCPNWR
ncbi:hypothetical protein [Streptomyces sp. NPDC001594]|uniref:hypothetical protein n=1 Tax=Streptomyces sp. NPDC001594 TaxID=3364590 RepID=UPI0036C5369B